MATSMLCVALASLAPGCGNSASEKSASAQSHVEEWQTLLSGDWTLAPGVEDYVCVRYTLPKDMYIRGIAAINPKGTHHTFLGIGDPSKPDGTAPCNVAEVGSVSLFGSGVGTNPVEFPKGVGMKLNAGSQLLLNLHLFNTGDTELSGTSGTQVLPIDESRIEHFGVENPAVTLDLNILPNQDTTSTDFYTIPEDSTLFAVLPHMHQLGIHSQVVAQSSIDGDVMVHDAPYSFDSQLYYPVQAVRMAKGDKVQFACTWRNTTANTVHFGQSSLDEMCAIGLYRYPGL